MGIERYSRQTLFAPIGEEGQKKIRNKHALLIGVGALGTSLAEMLTRAGIGRLTLIDRDYVEESNLQRQQLFSEEDALQKWPKAEAARQRLSSINKDVEIQAITGEADFSLLEKLAPGTDLILDGTDNFETRFLINDIAHKFSIPWIFGACVGSFGATYTILPGKTPCLHCLIKKLPMKGQTCDTVGIIAPTVHMVTAYQAAESLKILSGSMEDLRNTYVTFDLWSNQTLSLKADSMKDPACLTCGENPVYPFLSDESKLKTAVLCGRDTVQIRPASKMAISLEMLVLEWRSAGYEVSGNPYLISVKKNNSRMVLFKDGRALVHGTKEIMEAKKLYHSLMG
ncbi:ThiF family adenylyltransferase [Heyndrickxia acidicola]|uniref:ThiF family adenylyltransferase n=1 Tax=Heyndrickxia acidicola TaxID=209389 RepID=A0ABU6MDX3_9BACI|nr:ThiF family adenylyltransferase [Heyndrickxia acidicola]MED1202864.1 ThiF family adenylyltransferase [Heyndrickxia acidicola]